MAKLKLFTFHFTENKNNCTGQKKLRNFLKKTLDKKTAKVDV